MTVWGHVFLGVIALATLVMAAVQIGTILVAARLAKRLDRLSDQVEHEIKPILANLQETTAHASRVASLAVAQVERVDVVFGEVTARVEETLDAVQRGVSTPMREGQAVLIGVRAAIEAFRTLRQASRARHAADEEDALFIG